LGSGVFLSTIHAAKGMEFTHVIILDGDWRAADGRRSAEEERRLLYIAMTRARETLTLFKALNGPNPMLDELPAPLCLHRRAPAPETALGEAVFRR
jgi:ATP-dependent DNA helicase RecQ